MPKHHHLSSKIKGFTLIEVMVVIAIIGIIVTLVQFSFSGERPEDKLKQSSLRFSAVFESAAEYGLLNNIELGLLLTKNSYQFLGYDGVTWNDIPNQTWLGLHTLPEHIEITLELEDLPIDQPLLFDSSVFDNDEFSLNAKEDKDKKRLPQVYLLSGGDITAFSLTFQFSEYAPQMENLEPLAYRVTGIYDTRLTIEGPVLDDE